MDTSEGGSSVGVALRRDHGRKFKPVVTVVSLLAVDSFLCRSCAWTFSKLVGPGARI